MGQLNLSLDLLFSKPKSKEKIYHKELVSMSQQSRTILSSNSNTLWLTFPGEPRSMIIRSQLLGLGPDHSLLCVLPEESILQNLKSDMLCKGRSLLDGDTYQFETTIQEVVTSSLTLRLKPPDEISREAARVYPRLPVEVSGTVRPLSDESKVLAVLPATISNLCPTGCQLTAPVNAWPTVTSVQVLLTCQLPESSHNSKFHGKIEWIDPSTELHLGIQFRFQTEFDVAQQDLLLWFTSQQAKIVNTIV